MEIAEEHAQLQHHVHIIQRLGVDGMSSDESDFEGLVPGHNDLPRHYRVLPSAWRAGIISRWLRVFDSVHMTCRRNRADMRGALPRPRVYMDDCRQSKNTKWVPGLPKNAYEPTWLESLPDINLVRPNKEIYDFGHHNDLHW